MPFSFTIPLVSSRNSGAHSYHPVPVPDEEILSAPPESEETRDLTSKRNFFLDPSFWLTALAVLSIAVTIRNLLVIQLYSQESRVSYASFGSPYNGLGELVRNETSPSWPLSSTHYPDFIGATEGPRIHHALSNGSIVRLDSERTVMIQHRVRDFGLEHCTVKLEFSHSAGNGHGHTTRGYGHIGESPYLTLWRLEDTGSKAVLAPSTLPIPLPSREAFLGDIVFDDTRSMQSPSFGCNAGSIQTLEIAVACASDPCIVEFRLTQSPQRQGFWVVQSEQKSAPMSM
ncbi:hypothetical protein L210DRAFT_3647830 [Boletus edulis BED1]|uniref:Ubiquitin 3 binding protein But2 C-terminal domain-containing protein n=1 Tax=Boletus edulis BED1 TaxID=1328754 RepID=A0AAD4BPX3_BOLED|nr:hypothetical protein L210DRAFT_3647830 [Boletus edulis BED1]